MKKIEDSSIHAEKDFSFQFEDHLKISLVLFLKFCGIKQNFTVDGRKRGVRMTIKIAETPTRVRHNAIPCVL